jgi:hypothetical protein
VSDMHAKRQECGFLLVVAVRETHQAILDQLNGPNEVLDGPARLDLLNPFLWGALLADRRVNGCGPEGAGWLVPDFTPEMQAAGNLHDARYLIGGTEEDRRNADVAFALAAPQAYSRAVQKHGADYFAHRPTPLTHVELLVVLQAAITARGAAACIKAMPSIHVMTHMEKQLSTHPKKP